MTRKEVEAIFDKRREAMARRDPVAVSALYADDCLVDSPAGGTHTGREAVANVLRGWFTAFPDFKVLSEELVIEGNDVAQVMMSSGTDAGGFMGLPPTGRHFQFPSVFVYTLKNGQIAREQRIYDFTGMLVQIGVLKVKPGGDGTAATSRKDSRHAD
jgi:steroid delta-isomerase-like uncharacterized protein